MLLVSLQCRSMKLNSNQIIFAFLFRYLFTPVQFSFSKSSVWFSAYHMWYDRNVSHDAQHQSFPLWAKTSERASERAKDPRRKPMFALTNQLQYWILYSILFYIEFSLYTQIHIHIHNGTHLHLFQINWRWWRNQSENTRKWIYIVSIIWKRMRSVSFALFWFAWCTFK